MSAIYPTYQRRQVAEAAAWKATSLGQERVRTEFGAKPRVDKKAGAFRPRPFPLGYVVELRGCGRLLLRGKRRGQLLDGIVTADLLDRC